MKKFIPAHIRLLLKMLLRFGADVVNGHFLKFADKPNNDYKYEHKILLTQKILSTPTVENKITNIKNAAGKINNIKIYPGEIFSFWKIVGKPAEINGFKKGRNIINGKLKEDFGGGLCQLSGIIYHLALLCGLKIMERHNHTIDIYSEETRYTPLGADATVVYGYKDLRIKNNYSFPINFNIEINGNLLIAALLSSQEIREEKILFKTFENNELTEVLTSNESNKILAQSKYRKL